MGKEFSRGLFWLAVTVLIWGAYMPVGKALAGRLDIYWLTFIRYAASAGLLCLLIALLEGPYALIVPRGDVWKLLCLGALGTVGFGLLSYLGVRSTRPEHAAAIQVLTPINVAIFLAAATRRAPSKIVIAAALAVVVGAVLVVTRGRPEALISGGDMTGNLLVYCGSLCWMFYTLGAQRLRGYSPLRLTGLACLLGSPISLALALAMTALGKASPPTLDQYAEFWPQLIYLFFLVSAVSIITWNIAVRALGPQYCTLVSSFTPIIPFAWAWWTGQTFVAAELLGVAVILGAIAAQNLAQRRQAGA